MSVGKQICIGLANPSKLNHLCEKNVWLKPNQLWTILEFDEAVKQWSASVVLFAPIFQNAVLTASGSAPLWLNKYELVHVCKNCH